MPEKRWEADKRAFAHEAHTGQSTTMNEIKSIVTHENKVSECMQRTGLSTQGRADTAEKRSIYHGRAEQRHGS